MRTCGSRVRTAEGVPQYSHRQPSTSLDARACRSLLCARAEDGTAKGTVIGSPLWMAPEMIEEGKFSTAVDIWAIGITLIEVVEGKPPLADVRELQYDALNAARTCGLRLVWMTTAHAA